MSSCDTDGRNNSEVIGRERESGQYAVSVGLSKEALGQNDSM